MTGSTTSTTPATRTASSSEPLKNHAHNLKKEISKQTIHGGFLAMAEAIRAAVACTGYGAAAGLAVQKLASAGGTATELAYAGHTEVELKLAWRTYKKALRNPDDRIEARKALRKNPTLALYALSYSAKEKDAVALNVMRKMGASETTIDDANPHKVVELLEARFADDPKLYKPPGRRAEVGPRGVGQPHPRRLDDRQGRRQGQGPT